MRTYKKATEKDLRKCLRLMNRWNDRLDGVGWGLAGELCNCEQDVHAHVLVTSRAHTALLKLHDVDGLEEIALHEQLHLEMAEMARVVVDLTEGGIMQGQRQMALDWYEFYQDRFIEKLMKALLGMDKEIRSLKRKVRKMEKA